jgi:hypothetical protein
MPKIDIDWDDPAAVAKARGDLPDDPKPDTDDNADDDAAAAAAKAAKDADDAADADVKAKADADAKAEEDGKKDEEGDDKAKAGEGEDKGKGDKNDPDPDADPDPDVDTKGVMIPKGRYDSVKGRLNDAEAKIKEMEDAEAAKVQQKVDATAKADADAAVVKADANRQTQTDEIDALEVQYMKHLKDGEDDEALALRKQIRAKEQAIYHQEVEEVAAKAKGEAMSETQANLELNATYDYVEENFPVLNPENDDYDEALVAEIQELRGGFMATGKYSQTDALLKAVKTLVPEVKDIPGTSAEIDEAAKAAAKEKADAKKKADVEKALDTAKKQPTDMSGTGDDSNKGGKDTPDPKASQLTRTDFDVLPEEAKKRMRGDFAIPTE